MLRMEKEVEILSFEPPQLRLVIGDALDGGEEGFDLGESGRVE